MTGTSLFIMLLILLSRSDHAATRSLHYRGRLGNNLQAYFRMRSSQVPHGLQMASAQSTGLAGSRARSVWKVIAEAGAVRVRSEFVESRASQPGNAENNLSIVLIDIGVREITDVQDVDVPNWRKFLQKLKNSEQGLANDKFLYSHDVGDEFVQRVSIARIPTEMYQKLQLARSLLEGVSKNHQLVTVTMVNDFGEKFLDVDMCDALQSACETAFYSMPNMKMATGGSSTASPSGDSSTPTTRLQFLVQNSLLSQNETKDLNIDINNQNTDSTNKRGEIAAATDEGSRSWHYFQENKSSEIESSRKEKMSALEAAMTATSSSRREMFVGNQGVNLPLNNVASSRGFQDLQEIQAFLRERSAVNEGTNIARALSALPPNILNPETFVSALQTMASTKGWTMDQWTVEELKKIGCGAFCAVCQGNEPSSQDRLVRIKYFPKNNVETSSSSFPSFPRTGATATLGSVLGGSSSSAQLSARPVVLVGKGVTYDTGGVNLKSANSMKTMKHDMAGSAVALGVFGALASQTSFPHPVELWLAIVENNNGPNAYRPDDVVAAVTGDTIEVVHSDAEGRMLLADVLALASRKVRVPSVHDITDVYSPKIVCDFATLTGTCISSLSNRYIGGFSNRKELASQLIQAGEESGERCWPFPMDSDFIEDLKSDIADVLQCRQPTEADHIYAASFLQRFVASAVPWVHFDLSSAFRPGGNVHVNTDYTGSGVRCAVELLKNFISKSAIVK